MKRIALVAAGVMALGGAALARPAPRADAAVTISGPSISVNGVTVAGRATVGQPVTFTAQDDTGAATRFSWSFGDGTFDLGGASVTHVYDAPGAYTVTVDAVEGSEGDAVATYTVTVTDEGGELVINASDLDNSPGMPNPIDDLAGLSPAQ